MTTIPHKSNLIFETWPIERLIEYARNPRKNDHAVDKIASAIKEFGFRVPVVAKSDGLVVDGHLRLKAAKKLGLKEVPVILADDMTDAQIKAFRISVNRMAEFAEWDNELLALELAELGDLGFDLELTGFSDEEIKALMPVDVTEGLTDPDAAPAVQENPVTVPGDVWIMGKHRLMCGDSTSATDVERLLAGVKPHLMVTDPPYGVEYAPEWRGERGIKNCENNSTGKVLNDDRADWREAWALFPGDVAYVWHGMRQSPVIVESLVACDFELRAEIVWGKEQGVISRGHYHVQHESCWYAVRKGATGHWSGDRKQTTLWKINKSNKKDTGHGTQKPVECMRRPIENNSSPGQAVYEPFSGSGTTIIAAEQTGRRCYAMELSPQYVDVAVRRWQQFTGKQAIHADTGKPFAEVKHGNEAKETAAA